jgi:GDP-L-fucose synthase
MILVTGATGFLGSTVCSQLDELNLRYEKTSISLGLDLREESDTRAYLNDVKPDVVINCAAYVGGISYGYKCPADLFTNNMKMILSLFSAAKDAAVTRIVNPISNCVYPAKSQYFKEPELWDGPMHESVLAYGAVRKMSWVGSWAFNKQYGLDTVNLILSNMYGPGDHFDESRSHALGALVKKFIESHYAGKSEVVVWGSGKPVREWLYVEDGARALIKAIDIPAYSGPINIGEGAGISIQELADLIKEKIGYQGEIVLDISKPDGAPFKTVDGSLGRELLNWQPSITLEEGLERTIASYLKVTGREN